jgi:Fe-S-cluster-containing hydrogenase component 2
MILVIDKNLCPQNHLCPMLKVCSAGAITQTGFGLPEIDAEKCILCEKCVKICGKRAVYKMED